MDTKFDRIFQADKALEAHICGKLGIDPADNRGVRDIVNQIIRIRSEFSRKAEQFRDAANRTAEDLQRAAGQADKALANERFSINSLGVLQGRGPDLDRMAGELQLLSDHLALIEGPWETDRVGVVYSFELGDKVEATDFPVDASRAVEVIAVNGDGTYDVEIDGETVTCEADSLRPAAS